MAAEASWVPTDKPRCRYGGSCYRKNPEHFTAFAHPSRDVIEISDSEDEGPRGQGAKEPRGKGTDEVSGLGGQEPMGRRPDEVPRQGAEELRVSKKPRHQDSQRLRDEELGRRLAEKLQAEELAGVAEELSHASRMTSLGSGGAGSSGSAGSGGLGMAGAKGARVSDSRNSTTQGKPTFRANGIGFWLFYSRHLRPDEAQQANEHAVRLRDVVVGDIHWALLTNYMTHVEWLCHEIPNLRAIKKVALFYHKRSAEDDDLRGQELPSNFVRHAPPIFDIFGKHHSKCLLLGYQTGLRVVLVTANHIEQDHYFMTDGLWSQDFPLKDKNSPSSSEFETTLIDYFKACRWSGMDVDGKRVTHESLRDYDFSQAKVKLIASVPGGHIGDALSEYGHMRLRAELNKECFSSKFAKAPIVWQVSSIGSTYAGKFLQDFKDSTSAGKIRGQEDASVPAFLGGKSSVLSHPADEPHLIWPAQAEIRDSALGWIMGGSIPGQQKTLADPKNEEHLSKLYCRWSHSNAKASGSDPYGRANSMPHIKTLLRCTQDGKEVAWMYLGSHNLSGAAWGRLVKDGRTKKEKLSIMNWELGVLFLPSLLSRPNATEFSCTDHRHGERLSLDSPSEVRLVPARSCGQGPRLRPGLHPDGSLALPIPYQLPPQRYRLGIDSPWICDKPTSERDRFGNPHPAMMRR